MLANHKSYTAIAVSDLERARQFYVDTLGLSFSREAMGGFIVDSGGSEILIYQSGFAGTAQNTVMGWSVDDFDAVIADLRARGIQFEEYDFPEFKTVDGVASLGDLHSAWFKDPDGNILAVNTQQ